MNSIGKLIHSCRWYRTFRKLGFKIWETKQSRPPSWVVRVKLLRSFSLFGHRRHIYITSNPSSIKCLPKTIPTRQPPPFTIPHGDSSQVKLRNKKFKLTYCCFKITIQVLVWKCYPSYNLRYVKASGAKPCSCRAEPFPGVIGLDVSVFNVTCKYIQFIRSYLNSEWMTFYTTIDHRQYFILGLKRC